jgi:hypothetical protein
VLAWGETTAGSALASRFAATLQYDASQVKAPLRKRAGDLAPASQKDKLGFNRIKKNQEETDEF